MPNHAPGEAVLDTSVWMAVLNGERAAGSLADLQGQRTTVVTPLVLAELVANARRGRIRRTDFIRDVESVARYEPLTREDAFVGGELFARLRSHGRERVGIGDCLIYATARRLGAILITKDQDLTGEPGVVLLPS